MKISLCLLTYDRYEITKRTLEHNIPRMENKWGCTWELLWADQGSSDLRVLDLVRGYNPVYTRLNKSNEGIARAQNQLMLRATGDIISFFPNDILLPDKWLEHLLNWSVAVHDSGLVGMHCVADLPPLTTIDGMTAHFIDKKIDKVFGTMFFRRAVMEKIGAHFEGFDVYGLEDSDWNNRITLAGFKSFYIPGVTSEHIGWDTDEQTDYRKMKNESMGRNADILWKRMAAYAEKGYFEAWPPMREPV